MKLLKLTLITLLGLSSQVMAAPIVSGISNYLPPSPLDIIAPAPTYTNNGFGPIGYSTNPPSGSDPAGTTYVGLTQSYGVARSPFETVPGFGSAPFDSVSGGGFACFGTCALPALTLARSAIALPTSSFSFIYGSPDDYNTLTIFDASGATAFTGDQIVGSGNTNGLGYEYVTISGIVGLQGVDFASRQNAFEFAAVAVSAVPLPASFPLFGAALLGLGAFGYRMKKLTAKA